MDKMKNLHDESLPDEQILLFHENRGMSIHAVLPDFDSIWEASMKQVKMEGVAMENQENNGGTGKFLSVAAVFVALLGLGAGGLYYMGMDKEAPVAENLKAVVVYVNGQARALKEGHEDILHAGDILQGGDRVITETNGSVDITLTDRSIVRIRPNTAITIAEVARTSDNGERVKLSVESGSALSHIKKLGEKDSYQVASPTSVASVRGTTFELQSSKKSSTVTVGEGLVHVQEIHGDEQTFVLEQEKMVTITDNRDEIQDAPDAERHQAAEVTEMMRHASSLGQDAHELTRKLANVKSEEDLQKVFNKDLELIELKDGRELRGVIVSMENGKLLVQTVKGSHFIDEKNVVRVKYLK